MTDDAKRVVEYLREDACTKYDRVCEDLNVDQWREDGEE